jgi:hypothetical protein
MITIAAAGTAAQLMIDDPPANANSANQQYSRTPTSTVPIPAVNTLFLILPSANEGGPIID